MDCFLVLLVADDADNLPPSRCARREKIRADDREQFKATPPIVAEMLGSRRGR
jgi:hypothetical protein